MVLQVVLIILLLAALAGILAFFIRRYVKNGENGLTLDIGGQTPRASGGSDTSPEKSTRNRLIGLGVFASGLIAAIFARLWGMQLVSSEEYERQAQTNRTRTITKAAPRGRILDRNGKELVTNRPSLTVVAMADVADDDVTVQLLSNLLGIPAVAVRHNIQDYSEGAQTPHTVATDVSRRVVAFIGEHPGLFEGVSVEQRTKRYYPMGSLAAHVLGYTGLVTSEYLDAEVTSAGDIAYEAGDTVGQSGIERQYESVLQGVRGEQTVYVDASGGVTGYSTTVEPQSGSDIVLTIDSNIQKAAEESLAFTVERLKAGGYPECKAGCVVALDVTNGEVIALASYPTFNPGVFVDGISSADWEQLSNDESEHPLMNRVISGQYMSASTIKPLSTFAALDYGISTPESTYYCPGYWTGFGEDYGQYCWNHDGHGYLNLQGGITYSCDCVFYEVGKGFYFSDNSEGLQETFRRWGLGEVTGIDLPSEAAGRVPDAEWKWDYFDYVDDDARSWQGGDMTNLAIGQGDILVTPLQMACVYAGIGNRGDIWRPHVFKAVKTRSGEGTSIEYAPEKVRSVTEDAKYFDLVEKGLEGVIYEEDYAVAQHFYSMKETVAGKSGTGERAGEDPTGWFICFAPAEKPKYVVATLIENGGFGAATAMYVVRDTLGALFNEPDELGVTDASDVR